MYKAFDKVRHDLLIVTNCGTLASEGSCWIGFTRIFCDRRQRVTVLGATSRDLPVTSGVPQGSILDPALFLLYGNNLPDVITKSQVVMFADDTKVKKCKLQSITRKCKPISSSYEVNGRTIQSCEEQCDLRVLVDCDLTWRAQVCHQAARANKLLGYISRNARYIRSTSTRCTLYLGLVRAHFAYVTQVWAPQAIELISKLEEIQRRATKFILQLPFITEISYEKRLISLDLPPICYWHELLGVVFFFKATHNLVLSPSVFPVVRERARTTRASATSVPIFCSPQKM